MATEKQIRANRGNALKSSGPKTSEGIAVSSTNSLKHGLLSRDGVLDTEDLSEFDAFHFHLRQSLHPEGEIEHELADRIASYLWRMRRVTSFEKLAIADDSQFDPIFSSKSPLDLVESLSTITRYETALERGFFRTLHELQRLQALRSGHSVPLPVAVDVSVSASNDDLR